MLVWLYTLISVTSVLAASHGGNLVRVDGNGNATRKAACWDLSSSGQKLKRSYVIRDVSTTSLEECLFECENALFTCKTVDFGYDQRLGNGTCHLSDWNSASLDLRGFTDSTPDPNFNVFGKINSEPSDRSSSKRTRPVEPALCDSSTSHSYILPQKFSDNSVFTVEQPWTLYLQDVCFSRAGASRRLTTRFVRKSHDVTNLEACQLLCARETGFDCRGFNFRKSPSSSVSICELTTDNSRSVDVSSAFAFVEDHDAVFYEKVGRGVECDKYDTGYSGETGNYPQDVSKNVDVDPKWFFQASIGGSNRPILSGTNGCFRKSKSSYRLSDYVARQSLLTRSQVECEQECLDSKRFTCESFSYSFSNYPRDRKNCYLSDKILRSLDPRKDLVYDVDSDVFEKVSSSCRGYNDYSSYTPNYLTTTGGYNDFYSSKCFKKTRTGIRILPRLVRKTIRVKTPLDCEDECLRLRTFTCRSFSFRYYGSSSFASNNCELTDVDVSAGRDLVEDRDYDTWHKTVFSGSCENYGGGGADDYDSVVIDSCFVNYKSNSRIDDRAIKESLPVRNLVQCEQECSRTTKYKCSSFSFRFSSSGYGIPKTNCELSLWEATELDRSRELVYDPDYHVYTRSTRGDCVGYGDGGFGYNTNGYYGGTDVSASGVKCVRRCQENNKMGYWWCETDERGSWDYCCAPNSKCAYAAGQPIPWCFVGLSGKDQWRPCSERHADKPYSYLQSRAPTNSTAASVLAEVSTDSDRLPERLVQSAEEGVTSEPVLIGSSRTAKMVEVNGGEEVIVNVDTGLIEEMDFARVTTPPPIEKEGV